MSEESLGLGIINKLSSVSVKKEVRDEEVEEQSRRPTEVPVNESENKKAQSLFKHILEIPKISSTELIRKVLTNEPLFKDVYKSDSFTDLMPDENAEKLASILVSGFGLKSLQQLQEALEAESVVKSKKTEAEQFPCICSEESSEKSETLPPLVATQYSIEDRVKYLLQLEKYVELEGELCSISPSPIAAEAVTEVPTERELRSETEKAKIYLREHKIFQFFQFLMSHLLSAIPEDPIDYLLALLDRVLLYRAGLLSPPLLYEKKHIEQLFHLMDRFGQGYVDMQQYRTAMETLGICTYNMRPLVNIYSMVSKEVFIEEIFNAEVAVFNDLIRNRISCTCYIAAPPPTVVNMDLKAQSTISGEGSIESSELNPIASVDKFWRKHGEKQPRVYKGKFWTEFTRVVKRRDSDRKESQENEK